MFVLGLCSKRVDRALNEVFKPDSKQFVVDENVVAYLVCMM
jgi:hypothetical protein